MKTLRKDPWEEFTACGECESDEPVEHVSTGEDTLRACESCRSVEGATRTLWLNHETGEVTDVMPGPAAPPVPRPQPGTPEYEAAVVELRALIAGKGEE